MAVERSPVGQYDKWSQAGKKWNPRPPYKPGEFKGSWSYGEGAAPVMYPSTIDPTGAMSMARMQPGNAFAKHFIVNNAPYGFVLATDIHPLIPNWKLLPPNVAMFLQNGGAIMSTKLEFQSIVDRVAKRYV